MKVILNDASQEAIDRGLKNISWSVGKFVEKGKLSEQKETVLNRIKTCAIIPPSLETKSQGRTTGSQDRQRLV